MKEERKTEGKNPLNDSIESDIPREEVHTVKINKKKKMGDSLLNGIREKGLSRNHQVTIKTLLQIIQTASSFVQGPEPDLGLLQHPRWSAL